MAVKERIPEYVQTDSDGILKALTEGGRAEITLRSYRTGEHVTLLFAAKAKGPDGRYISRATRAGRVGLAESHKIDVTDPGLEWPDAKIGARLTGTGRWYGDTADMARDWAARAILEYAFYNTNLAEKAEVLLATRCAYCGKKLTDPVSVARGVGPECFGRATGSKRAAGRREEKLTVPEAKRLREDEQELWVEQAEARLAFEETRPENNGGLLAALAAGTPLKNLGR